MKDFENKDYSAQGEMTASAFTHLLNTFFDMLKLMRQRLLAVILTVVVCASLALGISLASYKPVYKTSVTFSITPLVLSDSGSGLSVYKFNYVFSFAKQMNETFPHIVESNTLRESIIYDLGRWFDGKITAEPVYGSNIFKVYVETDSPKDTADVMDSFIKCYPKIAEHIIGDTRIKVIHRGEVPEKPNNASAFISHSLIGALTGLALCLIVFFFIAIHRETVKDKNDIITKLNSHYICQIPNVNRKRSSKSSGILKANSKTPGFLESVRVMKKRIKARLLENESVIAVTSAMGDEGKTTISYNLAANFALGKERTLLIDMDFIQKSLQKQLLQNPNNCIGICDVVNQKAELKNAICNVSENFDILFAGSASCRFNHPSLEEIFTELKQAYDFIIVDMPPCGIVSDSALIADLCDDIVFVVKSDSTSVQSIKNSLQYVLYSKARLLGFILNDKDAAASDYGKKVYYSHYKKYGYRYNYNYGYGVDDLKTKKHK